MLADGPVLGHVFLPDGGGLSPGRGGALGRGRGGRRSPMRTSAQCRFTAVGRVLPSRTMAWSRAALLVSTLRATASRRRR